MRQKQHLQHLTILDKLSSPQTLYSALNKKQSKIVSIIPLIFVWSMLNKYLHLLMY